jgi:hypothetical protein
MAKSLKCVPDDVTLRCGVRSIIQVKTSDDAQGVTIKALGYDSTVASLNPTEGNTNNEGHLEVSVTCAQERACPGETTVTFAATGYDEDALEIECKTFASSVAYISEADRQRAKELLQINGDERKWLIRQGKKLSEFAIRPLRDLNLAQPIQRDDGGILKG